MFGRSGDIQTPSFASAHYVDGKCQLNKDVIILSMLSWHFLLMSVLRKETSWWRQEWFDKALHFSTIKINAATTSKLHRHNEKVLKLVKMPPFFSLMGQELFWGYHSQMLAKKINLRIFWNPAINFFLKNNESFMWWLKFSWKYNGINSSVSRFGLSVFLQSFPKKNLYIFIW